MSADEEFLKDAINDIAGGAAICFVGAGFSWGASDAFGKSVPSVADLCAEISSFPGVDGGDGAQLADLAEFCNDNTELRQKLITHLIMRLTRCNPAPAHQLIMQMPWRAVFTTNFDDVAERSLPAAGTLVVTPTTDYRNLRADRKPLYYLHGRALDFLEGVDDPGLVISESNYLEMRAKNRGLYSALENEVHSASRIFFIGYSLKDAEIASRLFAIAGLSDKSIVICGPSETSFTLNRLKKFGTVLPIGVDRFAATLPDPASLPKKKDDLNLLGYVSLLKSQAALLEIESTLVDRLFLSGEFSYAAFAAQQRDVHRSPEYCVPRKRHLDVIFSSSVNRFIITSDLGNGKSTFLEQLTFEAHNRGYEVFAIKTQLPETLAELDMLLASTTKRMYVIDGYVRYRKAVKHIGKRLPSSSILICATGQGVDDLLHNELAEEMGGVPREIDLNILDSTELDDWDRLLERWGFWEGRIQESRIDRLEFLRVKCGSENRSIILSIFRDTRLSRKIDEIVSYFLRQNSGYSKAFIAILINALCQNHVDWSRIVDWLRLDNSALKRTVLSSPVGDFMSGTSRWYEFTSTELASYILNNYDFDVSEIVEVYSQIVRETAYSADDPRGGFDARENLKELMRFRFLTKLFSSPVFGVTAINAVYQRLSNVQRIRDNDQFWLQWAMARMEIDDLENAETYLNTAIGLAGKKGEDYSQHQIKDQRTRLRFRKNGKPGAIINKKEIIEACSDLSDLLKRKNEPVVHPLRSAQHILDFLEEKADKLDQALITALREVVGLMKDKLPVGRLDKSQKGETELIRKNVRDCGLILGNL